LLAPHSSQSGAIGGKPIKCGDGEDVLDFAGAQQLHRFAKGFDHHLDVLVLVGKPVNAARLGRVHPRAKEGHRLGGAAGAGETAMHGNDLAVEREIGFFLGFTAGDLELALAIVIDEAGDDLELPGGESREMSGKAELFDKHDLIPLRIVEEHGDGAASRKYLARKLRAPVAGKESVPHAETIDAKESLIRDVALKDLQRLVVHGAAENETAVSSTAAL